MPTRLSWVQVPSPALDELVFARPGSRRGTAKGILPALQTAPGFIVYPQTPAASKRRGTCDGRRNRIPRRGHRHARRLGTGRRGRRRQAYPAGRHHRRRPVQEAREGHGRTCRHQHALRREVLRPHGEDARSHPRLPPRQGPQADRAAQVPEGNRRRGEERSADGEPRTTGRGGKALAAQPAGARPEQGPDPGRRRSADDLRVRHRSAARVRPARIQGAEDPPADLHVHRRGRGQGNQEDPRTLRPTGPQAGREPRRRDGRHHRRGPRDHGRRDGTEPPPQNCG